MTKNEIIAAIRDYAKDGSISPAQRENDLEDIEFAAQDAREKLAERFMED